MIFIAEETFDYHGLGPLPEFEIIRLAENFIEECYSANKDNILIITGKGQKVRPLVKKVLSSNKYVKSFKTAGYYNGQEGAFEVCLKS